MSFEAAEAVCFDRNHAGVYRRAMQGIVEQVFQVMLGAEVHFGEDEQAGNEDVISSYVGFDGSIDAALWLRCTIHGGENIAGLFMGGMRPANPEELDDAMREMANIFAGNLIKLLPHGARIGMPTVHHAGQGFIGEMLFSQIVRTSFELRGEVISLNFGCATETGVMLLDNC